MTIVEAARGCDRWRRHPPRRPCRRRPRPARSTARHGALRHRSRRLQGVARLARGLRFAHQGRGGGHGLVWSGPGPFPAPSRRRGDRGRPAQPGRATAQSGKSDPLDAVEAARAALGGRAKSISKSKDGAVEAIRVLVVAKRSARAGPGQGADPDAPPGDHRPRPAAMPPQGPDAWRR